MSHEKQEEPKPLAHDAVRQEWTTPKLIVVHHNAARGGGVTVGFVDLTFYS